MNRSLILFSIILLSVLYGTRAYERDPNTHSDPQFAVIKHAFFDFSMNLTTKTMQAVVNLTFLALKDTPDITLDDWRLENAAQNCYIQDKRFPTPRKLDNCIVKKDSDTQGNYLFIDVMSGGKGISRNTEFNISIQYELDNESIAIKWVDPEDTLSKEHPMMYTQCEAIYARTIAPLQDTPSVKFTWEARVKVAPAEIDFFMPGERGIVEEGEGFNIYRYSQTIPSPSFTLAMMAGNFVQQPLAGRFSIVAQPELIELAKTYFMNAETYLTAIEKYTNITYPYKQVTIAILHESFPVSSMENSQLPFISPSVLPTIKEYIDNLGQTVLIHCLTHGWVGNMVTNANWAAIWLNEGFATFITRQVIKDLWKDEEYRLVSLVGNDTLSDTIVQYAQEPNFQLLNPDTKNIDPERVLNPVPFEKGYQFLSFIQKWALGDEIMKDFVNSWIIQNIQKSVTNDDFQKFFTDYVKANFFFSAPILEQVNFDIWFKQPGMPSDVFQTLFAQIWGSKFQDEANNMAQQFIDMGGVGLPQGWEGILAWNTPRILMFINYFMDQRVQLVDNPRSFRIFGILEKIYGFSKHRSLPVQCAWVTLCLQTDYQRAVESKAYELVVASGDMSIIMPIYQAMKNGFLGDKAKKIYLDNKSFYHQIAQEQIQRVLFPA